MKITIFVLHLGVGGVEKYITTIANMLCEKHDVRMISTYRIMDEPAFYVNPRIHIDYLLKDKPNQKEIKESLCDLHLFSFARECLKALLILYRRKVKNLKAIKQCECDVIISTRIFHNSLIGKYAKKSIIKITGEHNHPHGDNKYIRQVIKSCLNFDYFIPISKELYDLYKEKLDEFGVKSHYIPFCIDKHTPLPNANITSNHLINVGRFSPEKGLLDLIRVFDLVHREIPDTFLDIVGDGDQRAKIENLITLYGLQTSICLHGFKSKEEVYKLYEKSACYVMTSFTESFGLVLLEAMSCGIGAFAFDSAEGAKEIISDGIDGYLIEKRNCQIMANAIIKFIKDKKQRELIYVNTLKKANKYSYENTKQGWLSLFDNLQKKGRTL